MGLGKTKIYFGKVVNVIDEEKMFRCQVSIKGKTDLIEPEKLPWYFAWYGVAYLPVIDDIVPVVIFDENITTGFYGKKLNPDGSELSDDDYENYLEIFKRSVADNEVKLNYTVTEGITFQNGDGVINIMLEELTFMLGGWGIKVTDNQIDLGEGGEASLLGDKTVAQLHDIIAHQNAHIVEMVKIFTALAGACTTPFTAPIAAAITPLVQAANTALTVENTSVDMGADQIQSTKTFIE